MSTTTNNIAIKPYSLTELASIYGVTVRTIKKWIDNGAPDINGKIKWADNPNRKK